MQRFRNILVGIDLSHADHLATSELNPPTLQALNRSIELAQMMSAELTIFSAMDVSAQTQELLHGEYDQISQNLETESLKVLDELVARAKQENVAAKRVFAFGQPWEEMTRQVLREKHDLVIVGTRNLSSAGRMLFGSTGMKLLRNCPCPVWVIRPEEAPEEFKILVASDFSDVSQAALDLAVNGAQMLDAKVYLLHALDTHIGQRLWLTGLPTGDVKEFVAKLKEEAEGKLHEQLAKTDYRTLAHGVQVSVVEGPADIVVLDAIEDHEIDLLVMGTVARGGLSGMLIGNTAEQLLPQVPCSVLAVKPHDFDCPVSLS